MMVFLALFFIFIWTGESTTQETSGDYPAANPYDIHRVGVGAPAPNFTLEDVSRRKVTLSDYRGKKAVVLVFYRGYW